MTRDNGTQHHLYEDSASHAKPGQDNLSTVDNPESTDEHPHHRSLIRDAMNEAERKAWDAFSRYKFVMGGYHAAQWVLLNKLLEDGRQPNPFADLVKLAQEHTVKD